MTSRPLAQCRIDGDSIAKQNGLKRSAQGSTPNKHRPTNQARAQTCKLESNREVKPAPKRAGEQVSTQMSGEHGYWSGEHRTLWALERAKRKYNKQPTVINAEYCSKQEETQRINDKSGMERSGQRAFEGAYKCK